MEITITIARTDSWVAEQRLKTGRNVSACVDCAVDPATLSEESRKILLMIGRGTYAGASRIYYDKDCTITSQYGGYGHVNFYFDGDTPTPEQIDKAIRDAAAIIASKRAAAEQEKSDKLAEEKRLASEWASLPIEHRTTKHGPAYCVPMGASIADYSGPLSSSGSVKYPADILKKHCPDAWEESVAAAKAMRDAELEQLKSWIRSHGTEVARLRLEEGFDSWIACAIEEYTNATAENVAKAAGLTLDDRDFYNAADDVSYGDRKHPTVEEIVALRKVRAACPRNATVLLQWVSYSGGNLEDDVKRAEIEITMPVPGAKEETRYLIV